jgi:uncharacterized protein with HEPN domain
MRENASKALEYARGHPDWSADELVVDAIAKRVEQVAEVAKYRLPIAVRGDYPEIPWDAIAGMRDRLVHDYTNVDVEILAATVEVDLPRLVATLDLLLAGPDVSPTL